MTGEEKKDRVFELCDAVRKTGLAIHSFLGPGHFEKVYENALMHRLQKENIPVETQVSLSVQDEDGVVLGDYIADIIVDGTILVEIKAVETVIEAHTAQLLGYLRATNIKHGLLVNFGAERFFIKKYVC